MIDNPGIFERGVRDAERGTAVPLLDSEPRTPNSELPRVTARISGFSRLPLQASQNCGLMYCLSRLWMNSLSLSVKCRSRLGRTPSKGRDNLLIFPARQKEKSIS